MLVCEGLLAEHSAEKPGLFQPRKRIGPGVVNRLLALTQVITVRSGETACESERSPVEYFLQENL